ncbi:MAG: RAMP superfamily CRISPR-associated protein [Candidatus Methanomethyliaceae archaeon]|nr:RAMP superfamily CRISPR-associated protein [Candidatus Methanomethyliaceae archaeon]MDW7971442.1 RAMP superfamily CRISPR-associated protein [Nitrososphaerota archaeon]
MSNYRDFNEIKILTKIEGTFVNETPIRIGSGGEPPLGASVDAAVYRINGKPCIPGSSLKGLFRAYAEIIAKSMNEEVHDPWDDKKIEEEKESNFCLICGIFGNTEIASHIRIYDSIPKNEARTFLKHGIAIDREFGSAKAGALFTEEFIELNMEWTFRMDVYNIKVFPEPDDKRGEIIRALMDQFRKGFQIGARKSVGAGLIKLKEMAWTAYTIKNGIFDVISRGQFK